MVAWWRPTALPIVEFGGVDQGYATMRVTSPYAQRGSLFHAGLDIGNARLGDDLVAVALGTVLYAGTAPKPWTYPKPSDAWWYAQPEGPQAGQRGGLYGPPSKWVGTTWAGRIIVIDHGSGYQSSYSHQQTVAVTLGQSVQAGQRIGTVGDSGSAHQQGHVHFGIHLNGYPEHDGWVDPWPLIRAAAGLTTLPDTSLPQGDPMLKYKAEGWTVKGSAVGRETPGGKAFISFGDSVALTSIGETLDGLHRAVVVTKADVDYEVYISRAELAPLVPGGDPAFNAAVLDLLLSREAPVETDCGPLVEQAEQDTKARAIAAVEAI